MTGRPAYHPAILRKIYLRAHLEVHRTEFGGRFVRVRGAIKVKCHLMFGISSSPSIRYSASKPSTGLTGGDSDAPSRAGKSLGR